MTPDEFWGRVDRSGGPEACWPWLGYTDANGYGCLRRDGRGHERAHRVALELDGRPVGRGLVGMHLCNFKRCCNPGHLVVGTHGENARMRSADGLSRGRRLLSEEQALVLRSWFRRGLATSVELAGLFGIGAERVRHIGSDRPYRSRAGKVDMNGNGSRKLLETAGALGRELGDVGKDERTVGQYFLGLYKRHEARRLVVGHRERRPSAEEALAIAQLVGVPEGSEPLAGRAWIACQDMPSLRVETVEFRWQDWDATCLPADDAGMSTMAGQAR